jgi:nucleoside-diphosphate-sugar epimerase
MKVIVTGGAGFVGTNLIKKLLEDGHTVTSLDNYSTGKRENEQDGCK